MKIKKSLKTTAIISILSFSLYGCGDITNNQDTILDKSAPIIETLKVDENQKYYVARITNASQPNAKRAFTVKCMNGSKSVKVYQNIINDIFGVDKIGFGATVKCKVAFYDNETVTDYKFEENKNVGDTNIEVTENGTSRKIIQLSKKDLERKFLVSAKNAGTVSVFGSNITYTPGREFYDYKIVPSEELITSTNVDNVFQSSNKKSFSLFGKNIKNFDKDGYINFYTESTDTVIKNSSVTVHLNK